MSHMTSIQSALQVISVLLWKLSLSYQSHSHLFLSSFNLETASNLLKEVYSFQSDDSHTVWCQDVTQILMSLQIHSVNLISRSKIAESELNWLRWAESSRSSRVLNSLRLDSSQNSWLQYLSWIRRFDLSNWVELENWNRVLTWNSRFDSSRHEAKYY